MKLEQIVWDRFGCLEPFEEAWLDELDFWEDYVSAFFRSNGLDYARCDSNVAAWLRAEDRAPFASMVGALLPKLQSTRSLDDIDIVLLAHWLPDLHLGTSVTNFVMHQLGLESAFGLAISDRGLTAPFFALDCVDRYLGRDGRRAMVVVVDQKHLLYRSPIRDALDPENTACLMLLERRPGAGLEYAGYRRVFDGEQPDLPALCRQLVHALALDPERTAIVSSDGTILDTDLPHPVVPADARLVCAAPFAALADRIEAGGEQDYLLLTRHDDAVTAAGFRWVAE